MYVPNETKLSFQRFYEAIQAIFIAQVHEDIQKGMKIILKQNDKIKLHEAIPTMTDRTIAEWMHWLEDAMAAAEKLAQERGNAPKHKS